jgi:hypothetical protein
MWSFDSGIRKALAEKACEMPESGRLFTNCDRRLGFAAIALL